MNNYLIDDLVSFYMKILMKKGFSKFRVEKIARVQVEIQAFAIKTHG
ncbi:MAG: hypothetical protein OCD02_23340 [Spirochaetaceae bacterium]